MPGWLEIGAFAVFGCLALSAGDAGSKAVPLGSPLGLTHAFTSASMLLMAVHGTTIVIFPTVGACRMASNSDDEFPTGSPRVLVQTWF